MCPPPTPVGQSSGVNISGSVGSAHDIVGHDKITKIYGPSAEEIVNDLDRRGVLVAAELAGLQRAVVIRLAQRLKPEALDFNQAVTELESAVDVALDVVARGERGTNLDAFIDAVLKCVAEETKAGDFDDGARTVDKALAALDRRETEQRDLARRSRVALLEEGMRVDTLRRDAVAVARRIEMLVATEHPTDRPAWLPEFRQRYDALYDEGKAKGINFSLSVAIELARRMAATAHDSAERGNAASLLGRAFLKLGEREAEPLRLEEAVNAFRAALKECTRERAQLDWATAQNELGETLRTLGERKEGPEDLLEAIKAFEAALEVRTPERNLFDWAETQNNLGYTFFRLGERERTPELLRKAVIVLQAAAEGAPRERAPLQWAKIQNDLGRVFRILWKHEGDVARLEQAIEAHKAALEERHRGLVPLEWASTQNNLGMALKTLGTTTNDIVKLEQAVVAFEQALQERTIKRAQLQWARTMTNLGECLTAIGSWENSIEKLEEAVAVFEQALKMRRHVPRQSRRTQTGLKNARYKLAHVRATKS